ncbi:CPBP family glutamic-type intramembrane protease [Flexibacterium corallicola]|uniref:CPBP family glutamic-type intramembrane protease n=1 Tax=Flexibacterium corallicola TaxID=3037259 RepID=UPI00286F0001|nr:CPBP family glutamic-type intramembrane protease [Pseudovibrio sp. M1P-2-3]
MQAHLGLRYGQPPLNYIDDDNETDQLQKKLISTFGLDDPELLPLQEELLPLLEFYRVEDGEIVTSPDFVQDHLTFIVSGEFTLGYSDETLEETIGPGTIVGLSGYLMANDKLETSTQSLKSLSSGIVALVGWDRYALLPMSENANAALYDMLSNIAQVQLSRQMAYTTSQYRLLSIRQKGLGYIIAMLLCLTASMTSYSMYSARHFLNFSFAVLASTVYSIVIISLFAIFSWLIVIRMRIPKPLLGMRLSGLPFQVLMGAIISVPGILVMAVFRKIEAPSVGFWQMSPAVQVVNIQMGNPVIASVWFLLYLLFFTAFQQYTVRCGLQVPLMTAIGSRKPYTPWFANIATAIAFGGFHINFGLSAVLLTIAASFYWGVIFYYQRSFITVWISHAILGGAAFRWFGVLQLH